MTIDNTRINTDNATEAAQLIAALVPALPMDDARDLARLLGHQIAAPSRASIREARLGLLIELISLQGDFTLPSEDNYTDLRAERAASGEDWPTSRTLVSAFGHWLKAGDAAVNHVRGHNANGQRIRVAASNKHCRRHTPYSRQDVMDDIKRARLALGYWPSEWEYEEFTRVTRRLARKYSEPKHRITGIKQVRTWFGDYPRAVQASRRFWAKHGLA